MKKIIEIGENIFNSKREAIAHYKGILNSYKSGQSLNDKDFYQIIDLLNYDYSLYDVHETENENQLSDESKEDVEIIDIRVSKVQFNAKCFEVIYSNSESWYISYRLIIERPKFNPFRQFSKACRTAVQKDIHRVKQSYFDKFSKRGLAPCQETGVKSYWHELAVDHRQPNTFSMIVDRFIELNHINIDDIEYDGNENNELIFKDTELSNSFRNYHMEKATLRIVRKECNSSRSSMARVKNSKKDLKINQLDIFNHSDQVE